MQKLEIEKYLENEEDEFHNPKVIIDILEDILEMSFEEIKEFPSIKKIQVTEDAIKYYLEFKLSV